MASKPPDAFLSYTRFDDQHDRGAISQLRQQLESAIRAVTGEQFAIFQDVDGIGLGEHWPGKLDEVIDRVSFFIPIMTPSYFKSIACRDELRKFLEGEERNDRTDLVLPVYYIDCPVLEEPGLREIDPLAKIMHERQRRDWRNLRHLSFRNRRVRLAIEVFAKEIDLVRRRAVLDPRRQNSVIVQNPSLRELKYELDCAIKNNELFLEFQPKIYLGSNRLAGVEALVQWRHPDRGKVPTDELASFTKDAGLTETLTDWTLDASLRELNSWRAKGYDFGVSVNIRTNSLRSTRLPDIVQENLKVWGERPEGLTLELTEEDLFITSDSAASYLHGLRRIGCKLSLDKFGTGYTSLSYMQRIPLDEVKIDSSFVKAVCSNPTAASIVRAVISLARSLKLSVVAEGVEEEDIFDWLCSAGCDQAQGIFVAHVMVREELERWLETRR